MLADIVYLSSIFKNSLAHPHVVRNVILKLLKNEQLVFFKTLYHLSILWIMWPNFILTILHLLMCCEELHQDLIPGYLIILDNEKHPRVKCSLHMGCHNISCRKSRTLILIINPASECLGYIWFKRNWMYSLKQTKQNSSMSCVIKMALNSNKNR